MDCLDLCRRSTRLAGRTHYVSDSQRVKAHLTWGLLALMRSWVAVTVVRFLLGLHWQDSAASVARTG
jgi:hypothetical protein